MHFVYNSEYRFRQKFTMIISCSLVTILNFRIKVPRLSQNNCNWHQRIAQNI